MSSPPFGRRLALRRQIELVLAIAAVTVAVAAVLGACWLFAGHSFGLGIALFAVLWATIFQAAYVIWLHTRLARL